MRHLSSIGSDLLISHLELQHGIVELAQPEMLMRLIIGLMTHLDSGQCEKRRNCLFRSFFGSSIGTCVDLWFFRYDNFDNSTMPANLLQTLIFFKQRSVEEASADQARSHEDAFRDWTWRVLNVLSNAEFASVAHDHAKPVLNIFQIDLR